MVAWPHRILLYEHLLDSIQCFGRKDFTVYWPAAEEVLCQYRLEMTLSSSPSTEGRLMVQLFKFNRDGKIVICGARRDDKMMEGTWNGDGYPP